MKRFFVFAVVVGLFVLAVSGVSANYRSAESNNVIEQRVWTLQWEPTQLFLFDLHPATTRPYDSLTI